MASSFIPTSPLPLSQQLQQTAAYAAVLLSKVTLIKATMEAMQDPALSAEDPARYAVVEAQFGLPAGTGADIVYMMSALASQLSAIPQMALLPARFGQV